jgi:hypothetical protein
MLKPLFLVKRLLASREQKLFPALPTHQHFVLKFHHAISFLDRLGKLTRARILRERWVTSFYRQDNRASWAVRQNPGADPESFSHERERPSRVSSHECYGVEGSRTLFAISKWNRDPPAGLGGRTCQHLSRCLCPRQHPLLARGAPRSGLLPSRFLLNAGASGIDRNHLRPAGEGKGGQHFPDRLSHPFRIAGT